MNVIDPRRRQEPTGEVNLLKAASIFIGIVLIIAFGVFMVTELWVKPQNAEYEKEEQQRLEVINQNLQETKNSGALKTLSGAEFRDLYNSFSYPNTKRINEDTPITGNDAADARIKSIAVSRGYQIRSAPVSDVFQDVEKGYELQQRAAQPWLDLRDAAAKANIGLGLTAAYRSAEDQKAIFIDRLNASAIPISAIGSGAYDAQISQLLRTTAIPGFSRHHTGYTIDISCSNSPAAAFKNTVCFQWLNANNYENAKKYGWIPSYPDGAGNQGPDPEEWEYVWVGTSAVTE